MATQGRAEGAHQPQAAPCVSLGPASLPLPGGFHTLRPDLKHKLEKEDAAAFVKWVETSQAKWIVERALDVQTKADTG